MEVTSGRYLTMVTETEGDNCFSICPIDMENFSFKGSKIVKNALYIKESARSVMHECQKVNSE